MKGNNNLPILRCLISVKIYIFAISAKFIKIKLHNVYIFLTAYIRAFQNRFDHVHTTFLGDSTTAQLGPII